MNDPTPNDPSVFDSAARDMPPATGVANTRDPVARRLLALAAFVALLALGIAAWQWHDTRGRFIEITEQSARRLAELETVVKESRLLADQAREATTAAQVKIGVLESRLAESQSQQIALEALYQELSRNRDEWGYAEIEQSLLIANQQLQLAGNIKAALIALQNADMRLQRMERPQLIALRKALNRDIERLNALPHVDIVGLSIRLDSLIGSVDRLPLAMDVRPVGAGSAQPDDAERGSGFMRVVREAWSEIRQLIRIQNMEKADVPLLAPQESFFLRENLKLRLIGARLALLGRDETSYKADLKAARDWLERYYDMRSSAVVGAAGALRNLQSSEITIDVPDLSATLDALRSLRPARESAAR